ncbi:primase-helicase family protein [Magnetovibrio sp. PR-2]|uniref:primase-helicase family protein n=1 Tax=Magnetovibrio sp. PR-2 TaxID=3120356 RepID=UPI002FCDFE0C
MKSGIDKNLVRKYKFEDLHWIDKSSVTYRADMDWLTGVCVGSADGSYLVKDKHTGGTVILQNNKFAKIKLSNEWCGTHKLTDGSVVTITNEVITQYLNTFCPTVTGTVQLPLYDRHAVFNNEKRINVWTDTITRYDETCINSCEKLLILIRESLCACEDSKTLEQILSDELYGDGAIKDEFKFLMHWLADIYQNPGINQQTNLWLIGNAKGIGKGTLMRVLAYIWGRSYGKASQNDIERGWNDFVEGTIIMEADEFKATDKIDFNSWLKKETTNPVVSINKRRATPYTVPNITNWIFTTNEENPIFIEDGDRRNVFIQTTSDSGKWGKYALDLNVELDDCLSDVAKGFAAILASIKVDKAFIARAFETKLRAEARMANSNAVEQWLLDNREVNEQFADQWTSSKDLFGDYELWRDMYAKTSFIKTLNSFGAVMTKLVNRGLIKKRRSKAGQEYYIDKKYCRGSNVVVFTEAQQKLRDKQKDKYKK